MLRTFLPQRQYPGRELDVYWLSTGRCGTRFIYQLVRTATNVAAFHDLGVHRPSTDRAVARWKDDAHTFNDIRLEDYPRILFKVRESGKYKAQVFTEFTTGVFPFGYAIWDYFNRNLRPRRVRLIHLVRHPVDTCRSILRVERDEGGNGFVHRAPALARGETSAEKAANVWLGVHGLCMRLGERLPFDSFARIRVEDLGSPDSVRALFELLELESFDEERITPLMTDRSQDVRHSHLARTDLGTRDASREELSTVWDMTVHLAAQLGYSSPFS